MHKLQSFSVAKLATDFLRLSMRLKSSGGRPSAPLGSRILTNPDDIFKHNMWDHVQWTEKDEENARQKAEENSSEQHPLKEQGKFDTEACQYWDKFYEVHQDKFFKDRRWLFLRIPRTASFSNNPITYCNTNFYFPGHYASFRILEVGCGVGNSVFPIDHPDYDDSVCHAFVHDICEEMASFPFPAQSLDVILAVFVLSSIHPERMQGVVNRLSAYLKHGGIFLFRDYGRYDFSQLRFKKGRCLSENFYTRGDGTCVYFFTKEEVHDLFSKAGLEEIQNLEDKRLQVNRGKKLKSYPHASS
uniref:tRNA N(3)-cytidine methyltransferase n=1 Tax=Amphiprion percula TaxID=161767 RepID=A0A3P8TXI0_AMPPE